MTNPAPNATPVTAAPPLAGDGGAAAAAGPNAPTTAQLAAVTAATGCYSWVSLAFATLLGLALGALTTAVLWAKPEPHAINTDDLIDKTAKPPKETPQQRVSKMAPRPKFTKEELEEIFAALPDSPTRRAPAAVTFRAQPKPVGSVKRVPDDFVRAPNARPVPVLG